MRVRLLTAILIVLGSISSMFSVATSQQATPIVDEPFTLSADPIVLTYNESTSPAVISAPSLSDFHASGSWGAGEVVIYFVWSNTVCAGTFGDIVTSGSMTTTSAGVIDFGVGFNTTGVFSMNVEWDGIESNCILVYVDLVPIELTHNGSAAPVLVSAGAAPAFDATGSWGAGEGVIYRVWSNTVCTGTIDDIVTSGLMTTSNPGAINFSVGFSTTGVFGINVEWDGIESSCVLVYVDLVPIEVTYGGSLGPVSVSLGSLVEFVATGGFVVGPEAPNYFIYTNTTCTGSIGDIYTSGTSAVTENGFYTFSSGLHELGPKGVVVEYNGIRSNCLIVNVDDSGDIILMVSAIGIEPTLGPVVLDSNMFALLQSAGLIPDEDYLIQVHFGDCDGDLFNTATLNTSSSGTAISAALPEFPGTFGFRMDHPGSGKISNCVIVTWRGNSPLLDVNGLGTEGELLSFPAGATVTLSITNSQPFFNADFGVSTAGCFENPIPIDSIYMPEGEATVEYTLPLASGTTLYFSAVAAFENSNCVRVITSEEEPTATPTNTPTATPTSTPTDTPTATPTDTPTSTPTDTPTATPTDTPTSTPTDTPTATPTDTPTGTPTSTPSGPTGSLELSIVTSDGGDFPDTALICVGTNCRTPGSEISLSAVSGSTFSFPNLEAGIYPVSVTNAAPYADASTSVTIVAGEASDVTIELTRAVQSPTPAVPHTPTALPSSPPEKPVTDLPNTGAGLTSGGALSLVLAQAAMLVLLAAAVRRRTVRAHRR